MQNAIDRRVMVRSIRSGLQVGEVVKRRCLCHMLIRYHVDNWVHDTAIAIRSGTEVIISTHCGQQIDLDSTFCENCWKNNA